ncbi:integrase [Salmonella enterica subsp. enterica serovar Newport str. S09097]|nr:integrase [Salmonella enterica subsp. enterica serovar Newport str. S09097]
MSLTDTKVKNSQTSGKRPSSSLTGLASIDSKYWQSGYRFDGKQKVFSIGVYLAISLADARQRRDEAKRLLAQGIDPNAKNRLMKKSFRKSAIKPARPVSSPKADAP